MLAHVYDDTTGAPQMILEGTDARAHFIRHTPAMEQMRQEGGLKPNSFVTMERVGASEADVLLKITGPWRRRSLLIIDSHEEVNEPADPAWRHRR